MQKKKKRNSDICNIQITPVQKKKKRRSWKTLAVNRKQQESKFQNKKKRGEHQIPITLDLATINSHQIQRKGNHRTEKSSQTRQKKFEEKRSRNPNYLSQPTDPRSISRSGDRPAD